MHPQISRCIIQIFCCWPHFFCLTEVLVLCPFRSVCYEFVGKPSGFQRQLSQQMEIDLSQK